jgi:DNA-binding transcriptional MerR regulator
MEIPNRPLFKAAEVCEIAALQPYVLRSWESEFPDLGVTKGGGGTRVYRRSDLERVLRIKQLVFSDGLTLAGVRRHIEQAVPAQLEESDSPAAPSLSRSTRERILTVKRELRALLDLLTTKALSGETKALSGDESRYDEETKTVGQHQTRYEGNGNQSAPTHRATAPRSTHARGGSAKARTRQAVTKRVVQKSRSKVATAGRSTPSRKTSKPASKSARQSRRPRK